MRPIWAVARRELRALFDQPTAYILLVVFVAVNDALFFPQIGLGSFATLRPMFELLPWLMLVLVPAVTMRAIAEDTRSGVIEVVLAQPITEFELLLGKYLGQLLFLWIALALTLPVPVGLALGSRLQWGVTLAQYVGAALLIVGLAAVGVWASTITRNQVTAFIVGVAVMFLLILVGLDPLVVGMPPRVWAMVSSLGVRAHFMGIARGVIDLRDAIYFLSLAGLFLVLAYYALMGRRLTAHGTALRRLRLGTVLLVVGLIVVNLFGGNIGGRLDLTPGHAYTLSPATRRVLATLNDLVTIKLFESATLPTEVTPLKRDVNDLLSDYRAAAHGKVRLVVRDPTTDTAAAREARSLGIPPVQFNVVGRSELEVKEGYLGVAVQYAEASKTIPYVQQSNDLEYRLTAGIRSLTRKEKPVVGIAVASDHSATASGRAFTSIQQRLEQDYAVRSIMLPPDSTLRELKVLILVGSPDSLPGGRLDRLREFVDSGGGLLLMAGGMGLSAQAPLAMAHPVAWNPLLAPYGVMVRSDMVYDLASNEQVAMPTQYGQVLMAYPLWIRALSTRLSPLNAEIDALFLPWASTIDTTHAESGTVTPLFTTSRAGGARDNEMFLNPTQAFSRDSLKRRLVAVAVNPQAQKQGGKPAPAPRRGRIVVVGTADFAADRYARNGPEAAVFVQNAVDWLAQDETLIAIRSKDRSPPPLVFASTALRDAVRYGNVIGIPVLLVLAGAIRWWRRRAVTRREYRRPAEPRAA